MTATPLQPRTMTAEQQFANLNHLMTQLLVFMGQYAEESKASSQRVEDQISQLSREISQLGQEIGNLGQETRSLVRQVGTQNDQIGRMTEVITMNRIDLTDLKVVVERQAVTAERQEQNITRLVGIVEALVQRPIT